MTKDIEERLKEGVLVGRIRNSPIYLSYGHGYFHLIGYDLAKEGEKCYEFNGETFYFQNDKFKFHSSWDPEYHFYSNIPCLVKKHNISSEKKTIRKEIYRMAKHLFEEEREKEVLEDIITKESIRLQLRK